MAKTREVVLPEGLSVEGNCSVVELPDGTMIVRIKIDPDMARRIKRRAGDAEMARFLWDNILGRAVGNYAFTGGV